MRPHLVLWLDRQMGPGWGELLAPDYVIFLSVAMLTAIALAALIGRARRFDPARMYGALVWGWLGALIGARLLTSLAHLPDALAEGNMAVLLRGGLTAYGGFLGGALSAWLALGRRDLLALGDVMAPGLGLATALTRVGCFVAGCDYGIVTESRLGVRFPPGSPAFDAHLDRGWIGPFSLESLPVHPTELYESALGLVICLVSAIALAVRWKKPLDGTVFLLAASMYAIGRSLIESLRGDTDRGVFAFVSTSQLVSVAVLIAVLAIAFSRALRRGRVG